ncbi:hypothetical protein QAD02_014543 [Eretmocerus hayati]|uniref:Uncharacterized protein n=1 Tax=Eretmocerus hayati TaxID=131215 RepID=A0ACC2P5N2_9HYME|nr:hypothetical protein QAD02_014543 [Eretmocerus hayati]
MDAPNCDEESSDVDDSCDDESYDSDVVVALDKNAYNKLNHETLPLTKRETFDRRFCVKDMKLMASQMERSVHGTRRTVRFSTSQIPKLILMCRSGMYIGITATGRVKTFPVNCINDTSGTKYVT